LKAKVHFKSKEPYNIAIYHFNLYPGDANIDIFLRIAMFKSISNPAPIPTTVGKTHISVNLRVLSSVGRSLLFKKSWIPVPTFFKMFFWRNPWFFGSRIEFFLIKPLVQFWTWFFRFQDPPIPGSLRKHSHTSFASKTRCGSTYIAQNLFIFSD